MSEEILSDDNYGHASWTEVFLGTCVDTPKLAPVDWSRAEVRTHIADDDLALRYELPGEIVELNPSYGLVHAEVEKLGAWVDIPLINWL